MAFKEFYNRYKDFLLKVCKKCCKDFDDKDLLADDIFQNTFLKVLSKANTFKIKSPDSSEKKQISEIKAWLSRIAHNELINFLRKNPDHKNLSNPFRVNSLEVEGIDEVEVDIVEKPEIRIQKDILDRALNSLSERDRYILMVYMQYFDSTQPLRHIPDDILENICTKFQIAPENVRQIKSRTLKRLKTEIDLSSK